MIKMKSCLWGCIITLLILCQSATAVADTVKLKDGHPDRHIVVKGDTLWDIAAEFLENPWRWPEIWDINPEIKNPHLIYPGDVIYLDIVNGRPVLKVERQGQKAAVTQAADGRKVVKLTPRIRRSELDQQAIPMIRSDVIKQFLQYPRIVSQRELDQSGYVVASQDGSLISGSDDIIYARGIKQSDLSNYEIVRKNKVYRKNGSKGKIIGIEVLRVADGQVERFGDPATVYVRDASREVLVGDRLLANDLEHQMSSEFLPREPGKKVRGSIIAVIDGVSRIGQYHTIVISLGKRDQIEEGNILAVYQSGKTVRDPVTDKWDNEIVLPEERAGTVMVVKAFDQVSYALVMEADRDIRIMDSVANP